MKTLERIIEDCYTDYNYDGYEGLQETELTEPLQSFESDILKQNEYPDQYTKWYTEQ